MSARKNGKFWLQRIVDESIEGSEQRPRMLIPVAWPVLRCDHNLVMDASESLGLLPRYVIECLARFGPRSPEQLSGFLGLSNSLLPALLAELLHIGAVETTNDGKWSAVQKHLKLHPTGFAGGSVTQEFAFLVNGFNGELLPLLEKGDKPIELKKATSCWSLTAKHLEFPDLAWMKVNYEERGTRAVEHLLKQKNPVENNRFGIPRGAQGLAKNHPPNHRETLWWLCALTVDDYSRVQVQTIGHSTPVQVLSLNAQDESPVRLTLIRKEQDRNLLLNARPSENCNSPKKWESVVDVSVNVKQQSFHITKLPAELAEPTTFLQTVSRMPPSLQFAIKYGYFYEPHSGRIWNLRPQDRNSCNAMLLARGVYCLQQLARREETPSEDPESWWQKTMKTFLDDKSLSQSGKTPLTFQEVRTVCLTAPDSSLMELLDSWE